MAMVAAAAMVCAATAVRAGGADLSDEDISSGADGPSYIGFVRLVGGAGINDAKVTAELKGGALVTVTDVLGLYKLPGFGKSVNPDDVKISCAKDGYKQANVVRHPRAANATTAVETDCYLQKL